jgi:hypothetical protein
MKNSLRKWMVLALISGTVGCLSSSCAWSIGDGKEHTVNNRVPTRGQELIDLKKARDQGAITEDEYQAQRKGVMEKQ